MRENEAAKRLQSIQTERFFREGKAGASRCLRTSVAETPSSIALPEEARDVDWSLQGSDQELLS